jgi:tetraacyldisaccharide 4'-kinase
LSRFLIHLRLLLIPLAALWWLVAVLRVWAYQRGFLKSLHPAGPTVSIGNISAGGTGKTPFLFWMLSELEKRSVRCGVLSRGYGGDEGRMLDARFPNVALAEGADRVAGMHRLAALEQDIAPEVYLLDDGFQHQRLQRDFDFVLVDATQPFGLCLPAGNFRESASSLRRAQIIILTRATQVSEASREKIWAKIDQATQTIQPRIEGDVFLSGIFTVDDGRLIADACAAADWLKGRKVRLAAGIGNPESFRSLVEHEGAFVQSTHWLKDHAPWSDADVKGLDGLVPVLVTEKDGVKLRGRVPQEVYEVRVDWRFTQGADAAEKRLDEVVLPVRASKIEPLWAAIDPGGDAC